MTAQEFMNLLQKDFHSVVIATNDEEGRPATAYMDVMETAKLDERREARVAMIDANGPALSNMYTVDDNLMVVFYLEDATATIYSFTEEPKVIKF